MMFSKFRRFIICCSAFSYPLVSAATDYLADDWAVQSVVSEAPIIIQQDKGLVDVTTVIAKGDLAYASDDQISLARASLGLVSEGSPDTGSYLKADLELNYYHPKDDALNGDESAEYVLKINDLWVQFSNDDCSTKLGRQGIFWGSVEGTGALDMVSPLDFSEPLLTDYSQIKRAQDSFNFTCFSNSLDAEIFLIPSPLVNLVSPKQPADFERLEAVLKPEWGARVAHHREGFDFSVHLGRFFENSPDFILNPVSFEPEGLYVSQFMLYGFGTVLAVDRLLLEMDVSYRKEQRHAGELIEENSEFLGNKPLKERVDVSLGFEYTTSNNHSFSGGAWFYPYRDSVGIEDERDTLLLNANWSRQYLNDDLTLSVLALWQKYPESYQFTLLSEYLINDYWSVDMALSYQHIKEPFLGAALNMAAPEKTALLFTMAYQF
ncbi:MAG: hypothetical protein ACMZ64_10005 [Oleiphilus sp.]